jgi:hypothetical protein
VNEGRNRKLTFKLMFDYLLNKYTKAGPKDQAMKWPRSLVRQELQEQLKQTKPEAKGKKIVEQVLASASMGPLRLPPWRRIPTMIFWIMNLLLHVMVWKSMLYTYHL